MDKAQRGEKSSICADIIGPWYLRGNQWGIPCVLVQVIVIYIFTISCFQVSALGKSVPLQAVTSFSSYVPLLQFCVEVLITGNQVTKATYLESSLEYIELFLSSLSLLMQQHFNPPFSSLISMKFISLITANLDAYTVVSKMR